MKKSKLVGLTLMIASVLLQVGYAATNTMQTVSTRTFKVKFEGNPQAAYDPYMEVTTQLEDGMVKVSVQNLYPGGKFSVASTVRNTGEKEAEIIDVQVKEAEDKQNSHELYKNLQGYVDDKPIEGGYSEYLAQAYQGKLLKPGEAMEIVIDMGLSVEVTELQGEQTQFNIIIQFAQSDLDEETGSGGNGGSQGGGSGSNTGIQYPDINRGEEALPGESTEVDIEEETLPGGSAESGRQGGTSSGGNREVDLLDENIPGGVLPQTGGVSHMLIYSIGIVLLGSGLAIYKKKV